MNRNATILMCVLLMVSGIFFISDKAKDTAFQNKSNSSKKIERESPESLISQFYNVETTMDETHLKQFFYLSKIDTSRIKLKIKSFQVEKIKLDKIIKIEEKNSMAVLSCSYQTYFKGIKEPRPDIEVITLVNKEQSWYIVADINEIGQLNVIDKKWQENAVLNQKKELWTNKATVNIYNSQASFDEKNKAFMEQGSKKLEQNIRERKN